MTVIGTAYVEINALTDKLRGQIEKAFDDLDFSSIGKTKGEQFGTAFSEGFNTKITDTFNKGPFSSANMTSAGTRAGGAYGRGFNKGLKDNLDITKSLKIDPKEITTQVENGLKSVNLTQAGKDAATKFGNAFSAEFVARVQSMFDVAFADADKRGEDAGTRFGDAFDAAIKARIKLDESFAVSPGAAGNILDVISDAIEEGARQGMDRATEEIRRGSNRISDTFKRSNMGARAFTFISEGAEAASAAIQRLYVANALLSPLIGGVVGAIGSLVGGLTSLASAALYASQSSVVLLNSMSALAQGAIALKVGMSGVGDAWQAASQLMQDPKNEAAIKKYNQAMKQLSPQAQRFIKSAIQLKKELKGVKLAVQDALFTGLNKALDSIRKSPALINIFKNALVGAAKVIGDLVDKIAKFMVSVEGLRRFKIITEANTEILKSFANAAFNLFKAFTAILTAAAPLTKRFAKWVETLTEGIAASLDTQEEIDKLSKKFEKAADLAKQFGNIFKNVWGGLTNIFSAALGPGTDLLDVLENASKKWEEFTGKKENQEEMQTFFTEANKNLRAMGRVVGPLIISFLKLGASPALERTFRILNRESDTLPGFKKDMDTIIQASIQMLPWIAEIVVLLARIGAAFARHGDAMEGFFRVFFNALEFITPLVEKFVDSALGQMALKFFAITKGAQILITVAKFLFKGIFGAGFLSIGKLIGGVLTLGGAFKRTNTNSRGFLKGPLKSAGDSIKTFGRLSFASKELREELQKQAKIEYYKTLGLKNLSKSTIVATDSFHNLDDQSKKVKKSIDSIDTDAIDKAGAGGGGGEKAPTDLTRAERKLEKIKFKEQQAHAKWLEMHEKTMLDATNTRDRKVRKAANDLAKEESKRFKESLKQIELDIKAEKRKNSVVLKGLAATKVVGGKALGGVKAAVTAPAKAVSKIKDRGGGDQGGFKLLSDASELVTDGLKDLAKVDDAVKMSLKDQIDLQHQLNIEMKSRTDAEKLATEALEDSAKAAEKAARGTPKERVQRAVAGAKTDVGGIIPRAKAALARKTEPLGAKVATVRAAAREDTGAAQVGTLVPFAKQLESALDKIDFKKFRSAASGAWDTAADAAKLVGRGFGRVTDAMGKTARGLVTASKAIGGAAMDAGRAVKKGAGMMGDAAKKVGGGLKNMGGRMMGLVSMAGPLGAIFSSLGGDMGNIGEQVGAFLNNLPTMITKVAEQIPQILAAVATKLPEILSSLTSSLPGVFSGIADAFPKIITALSDALPMVFDALQQNLPTIIGALGDALTGAIGFILEALPQLLPVLGDLLVSVIDKLGELLPPLIQKLGEAIPIILQKLTAILPGLLSSLLAMLPVVIKSLLDALPGVIEALLAALPIVIQALADALPVVIEALAQLLPQLIQTLATLLPQIITTLVGLIPMIITAVVNLIPMLIQIIADLLPMLITTLVDLIPVIITAVVEAIPEIVTALTDAIPDIISALVEAIPEIITAVVDAIPQIIEALVKAVPDVIEAMINAVKELIFGKNGLIGGIGGLLGGLFSLPVPGGEGGTGPEPLGRAGEVVVSPFSAPQYTPYMGGPAALSTGDGGGGGGALGAALGGKATVYNMPNAVFNEVSDAREMERQLRERARMTALRGV